jgi:hypothetical protein
MSMAPGLRKFALTAHVTFSVGWLGAVIAYLASVIVPLGLAALLSGLVQSLGTEWGLFRFYWVVVKLVLTLGAVTVLLMHMPAVARRSGVVAELVHAGGGLLVLLVTTTLSVFKPWGRIRGETTAGTRWGLYVLLGTIGAMLLFVALHLTGGGHGGQGGH